MQWKYVQKPQEQWLGTKLRENKGQKNNPDGQPAVDGDKPFTHEQHTATT